jgi:hypothetical protein
MGALILFALGLGLYFVLRFGGNWMEIDTANLTMWSQAMREEAELAPPGKAYPHGFSYSVVVMWLSYLTGVPIPKLQTIILPIVGTITVAVVAWMFFRTVLGKPGLAMLATMLLCMQPDFIIVTCRGSHEKLTWPLTMLAVSLLYRSATKPHDFRRFAIHVGLFYMIVYALVTINSFFASTFIAAIIVSLLVGLAVHRLQRGASAQVIPHQLKRLVLISASGMIFLYFFIFHMYAPARDALNILPTMVDKVATLFLGFLPQTNPYAYIGWGWISPWAYLALSLSTWLLLLTSLVEWLRQGYHMLTGASLRLPEHLPWLLYAGFAVQVAVAIVLDLVGILGANLQLRILPGVTIFGVVLVVQALDRVWASAHLGRRGRRLLYAGCTFLVIWFAVGSLLKATIDPSVSNKWIFYQRAEESAIEWADTHLESARVWAGIDERLSALYTALYSPTPGSENLAFDVGEEHLAARYFILSETERLRHARFSRELPAAVMEDRIYDNGSTQLYHRWPDKLEGR